VVARQRLRRPAGAWDLVVQVRSGARTTEVPLVLVTRAPPTTSVVAQGSGDLPDIETVTMSSGEQFQLYLDPGAPGTNEFHVTAFDPKGEELELSGLVVVATGPDARTEALDVTRLTLDTSRRRSRPMLGRGGSRWRPPSAYRRQASQNRRSDTRPVRIAPAAVARSSRLSVARAAPATRVAIGAEATVAAERPRRPISRSQP
jgi:hypothetical protein